MRTLFYTPIMLIFLIAFSLGNLQAQVRGKVYDKENQTPLEQVLILSGDRLLTRTGGQGTFTLSSSTLPDTLTFRRLGYHTRKVWITPGESLISVNMASRQFDVGDVVVRAYNTREKSFEAPGPLNLLHSLDIQELSTGSTAPVMNSLPGLYMHHGAKNTNRITIRGIGSRSQYTTTKLKAYLNGIPLTSGVGETTLEDLDLNLVDRITILKGPSSSIHGAALGGTILYRMGSPSQQGVVAQQKTSVGSFHMLQNATHLSWKGQRSSLRLAYDKHTQQGFRTNDDYNRDAFTAMFRHQINPKMGISYLGRYHHLKAYIPSSIDRQTFNRRPGQAAENWNAINGHEAYSKMLHGLSLDVDINEALRNETSVFFKQYDGQEIRPFNTLDDQTRTTGLRSLFEWSDTLAGGRLNAEAGYEMFQEAYDWDIHETLSGGEVGTLLNKNSQKRIQSNIFSALSLKWERLGISLGANLNRTRYDYQDQTQDTIDLSDQKRYQWIASPRLSLTYRLSKNLMAFGNISHGFSAPSYEETLNAQGFVNGSIQPETGWSRELGVRARGGNNRWLIKLSGYSITVKNLLVTKRLAEDRFRKINAGETRHNGLELMGKVRWLDHALVNSEVDVSYTLTDYRFRDFTDEGNDYSGNQLPGIPKHKLFLKLQASFPAGLYLQANWMGVGKMPMNDSNSLYSDPYNRLNLKAGIRRSLSSRWSLNLYGGIRNATDHHYASMILINAPSYGGAPPRYFYPARPRNYFAGLSLRYAFRP